MSVSLCIADPQGNAQTISVLRDPSKTSQISWARAVKLLRDRRLELEKTISDLTKDEGKKLVSLSLGEAAVVRLWPKLRARGFNTFDTIPRLNPTIARTKFSCPILGSADTADTAVHRVAEQLTGGGGPCRESRTVTRPTHTPTSIGGSRERA